MLSRHSLGNGTMVRLLLLSLRWGINTAFPSKKVFLTRLFD
ncbi:MAG: hypothetical protein WBI82_09395 [Sphaerochaeta sp.]